MSDPKEYQIRQACHHLWRQHPSGASTFSACSNNDCVNLARGGLFCAECCTKDLGKLVGIEMAREYNATVMRIRLMEHEMQSDLKEDEVDEIFPGTRDALGSLGVKQ